MNDVTKLGLCDVEATTASGAKLKLRADVTISQRWTDGEWVRDPWVLWRGKDVLNGVTVTMEAVPSGEFDALYTIHAQPDPPPSVWHKLRSYVTGEADFFHPERRPR